MEKVPFFDLLTILLPGALLTIVIQLFTNEFSIDLLDIETNQYFALTVFLSSSIFLGSLLGFISEQLLPVLRRVGLYTPIAKLYPKMQKIDIVSGFYGKMMEKIESDSEVELSFHEKIERVWTQIYFYLEANEKIGTPKSFQSFYFFFRNFFTMCLILLLPLCILIYFSGQNDNYILLSIINVFAIILSILAGRWNRKKMVDRVFWIYFSLKNSNI
jgi:hypothetical protein